MDKYILSIDQGTTSTRGILFDKKGREINSSMRPLECLYPHRGWVEIDANVIWLSVIEVISEVMIKEKISYPNLDSIAITNQRETTIIWDKKTGNPVYNAVIWQSRQTSEICDKFLCKKDFIHQKTGLLINPYFSASKIRFILDHIPDGQRRAENGELMFGTVDSWLIYKLTGGKVHATDVSNASRTLLFNINTLKWDDELCALFNIPKVMLPKVCPSSYNYGKFSHNGGQVPICGVAGDQQASLFGHTCFSQGDVKNTYGTGCFMLMNTGNKPSYSKDGLLTTVAWKIGNKTTYAIEGSVYIGGAVIQWLRDEMKMINEASESETLALSVNDTSGIYIVPAFVGLGTPYWDDEARGAVFGLTRGSNRAHFVRAALESMAYQCKDVLEVMKTNVNCDISKFNVDGGATANKYLLQFQSDISGSDITLPCCLQTTALGAAFLAGLCTGFYKDQEYLKSIQCSQAVYKPKMANKDVDRLYNGWKEAVKATRMFKCK